MFRQLFTRATVLIVPALVFVSTPAGAVPIADLFNTGVDASGALLVGGDGVADPHWDVISGPGISSAIDAVTYLAGSYLGNGPDSRWISSSPSGAPGNGSFVFRATFNLAGFDPLATSFSGRCATDNGLTSVALNGVAIAGDCDGFSTFSGTFSASSGFSAGVNTLDFTVVDFGPPMAFRAEFTATSTRALVPPVPEPGILALFGAGLAALALIRRRVA